MKEKLRGEKGGVTTPLPECPLRHCACVLRGCAASCVTAHASCVIACLVLRMMSTQGGERDLLVGTHSNTEPNSPPHTPSSPPPLKDKVRAFFAIPPAQRPDFLLLVLCGFFFVNTVTVCTIHPTHFTNKKKK